MMASNDAINKCITQNGEVIIEYKIAASGMYKYDTEEILLKVQYSLMDLDV